MPQGAKWLVNSATVGKYVNKDAPAGGGVKVGVIKPGSGMKMVGRSLGDVPLDISVTPSGPVYVAALIVNGGETTRLCTQFTGCVRSVIAAGSYKMVCRGGSGDPACTAAAAVPPVCGSGESAPLMGITMMHNTERANAIPTPTPALAPLCWDTGVAATAQAWADGCQWAHNPAAEGLGYGENLFAVNLVNGFPLGIWAADLWASGANDYDYTSNTCTGFCDAYTQMVWRAIQYLGCGTASCTINSPYGPSSPDWTFVVCNYAPPGNVSGEWPY